MSWFIDKVWYGSMPLIQGVLYPFSLCYKLAMTVRRWYLERFCQTSCSVPLIVIGNISVGGVGKTPLVIELAQKLTEKGLKVGIVSRGYGARINQFPYEIQLKDEASLVGDEPLLLAQKTGCPVIIAPQRTAAVNYLLQEHHSQIILSDDGLQHYRMGRAIEIAVIDGTRGLGNGFCLPAGPLREPPKRLKQVDFIVVNEARWDGAYTMHLQAEPLIQLSTFKTVQVNDLPKQIAAIAGIGNPQRFYSTLSKLDIKFTSYSYPDHYQFKANDLKQGADAVIMTEKDAIKCRAFSTDKVYFLPVRAVLDDSFWDALWSHPQLQGYC
ncbi:tetraacyldisaccharide 4'-kinase [Legionella sp. km772]|uniref:tetraacyldisaccharide 4'-kinase n=1 Tax=Legionella sp. km772 TaxID=2498111 RepID=UPI000F8C9CF8|nr:tetraacyldisaccharide 4'-kinase [Legionella sp. km772]RUR10687.1 tetraacyldisaccharide 4'-kinase [Legionella sp. km772]